VTIVGGHGLTAGQLSSRAGVAVSTLHFYARFPPRSAPVAGVGRGPADAARA
jgi:hypothetical protein